MGRLYIKKKDGTYVPQSMITVSNIDIVQETGDSKTSAMSQDAVTKELAKKTGTPQPIIPIVFNFLTAPEGSIDENTLIGGDMPVVCKSFDIDDNGNTQIEKFSSIAELYELLQLYSSQKSMLQGYLVKVHNLYDSGASTYINPIIVDDNGIQLVFSSISQGVYVTSFGFNIKSNGTLYSAMVEYKELATKNDIVSALNTEV